MLKLDKQMVREFERTQKSHGTEAAIYNVIWTIAADLMKAAGVTSVKTRMRHLKV